MLKGGFAIIISYFYFIGLCILSPYNIVVNISPVYNNKFETAKLYVYGLSS